MLKIRLLYVYLIFYRCFIALLDFYCTFYILICDVLIIKFVYFFLLQVSRFVFCKSFIEKGYQLLYRWTKFRLNSKWNLELNGYLFHLLSSFSSGGQSEGGCWVQRMRPFELSGHIYVREECNTTRNIYVWMLRMSRSSGGGFSFFFLWQKTRREL